MDQKALVWFRQDLRLHDNEALVEALQSVEEIFPVYVFDERWFKGNTKFGFRKCDVHRARFIIESVEVLRKMLRSRGSDLVVRMGLPEDEIFNLAKSLKTKWIFCNRERTTEEVYVQDQLEQKLWTIGQEIRFSRGKMLYYTGDLPFPITHAPDAFSSFRKEVLDLTPIRKPLAVPDAFNKVTGVELGEIPTIESCRFDGVRERPSQMQFRGGEEAGKTRLAEYVLDLASANGRDASSIESRLSPWISQGCLSTKFVYHQVAATQTLRQKDDPVLQKLIRRDFLRLMGKKYKSKIFLRGGTLERVDERLQNDSAKLNQWIQGETGVPLVDAYMKELSSTGFISNKGRLIVANYLVWEMQVNWQMGASYFESILLDYDPCSNFGNWNRIGRVDLDDQRIIQYNLAAQLKRQDSIFEYIKKWAPRYASLTEQELVELHPS